MEITKTHQYQVTMPVEVIRFDGEKTVSRKEEVCTEEMATIVLNGESIVSLAITPDNLEAFAYGHLVCEGWIPRGYEITSVRVDGLTIHVMAPGIAPEEKQVGIEIRSSGCPGRRGAWREITGVTPDGFSVSPSVIFAAGKAVNELAVVWQQTGGTHCSVIMDASGRVLTHAEDMGRHSSIDKAVGLALQAGMDLSRVVLACSGRMPADMVAKGVRAGVPVIVSHNAPFIHGIELARDSNTTLVGFVRPPRMNVYSAPHRISFQP